MKKVFTLIMMMFLMILISCELKEDATDDGTVTPTEETIDISSPVSGDTLTVSSSADITWTSNISQNVNVDLTVNNGKTWISLAANIENVGSFVWDPIPNNVSDQCRIRVMSVDSSVSATSTGLFSIVEPEAMTVELLNPNGGEVIIVGSGFNIKWSSTSIDFVKLNLSTDNGSNWLTITESTPADTGIYSWNPVPNVVSTECLLRVSAVGADSLFDVCDENFTVSVPKEITVVEPNGGDSWTGNTSQTIKWNSSEVENVKIEYTLNNGVNWNVIAESTESDGFYTWDPVPNQPSSNAKVRITNTDGGFPSDESDAVFSIEPELYITVLTPNGTEEWLSGSGHYIQWKTSTPDPGPGSVVALAIEPQNDVSLVETNKSSRKLLKRSSASTIPNAVYSSNSTGGNLIKSLTDVKIEYSTNNGGTWYTITESTPNNGNYLWNPLPVHNSALCVIRISDADDGVPFDISDDSFTISENPTVEIIVASPNGGEAWNSGTSQTISWNSKGITSVDIEYSTNNGVDWISIESDVPSSGLYNWAQVPNTSSNNCKVRISNSDSGIPFDESNSTFSILPEPGITVLAPNGGETLQTGTSNNITWTSENIANVKLELTTNNGANWTVIEESTPSDGNYNWTSIPDLNSSLCKIKISDADDGIPLDISDESFVITNQIEQSIEISIPNGGETWEAGTSKLISWASNGIDSVMIEFSSNNGISWNVISESVENTGSFDYTVPNVNSTQAKIRISDLDGDPVDESNGTFTIKQAGYLKILKPETGEVWISGELYKIEWEAQNVEKIKIEVTTEDEIYDPEADFFDDAWYTLTEDAPGAQGFYETRFTTPSNLYRIRISDSQAGSPADFSGLFTVKERPVTEVVVTSPNGGEKLYAGDSYSVKWTSENVEFVDIEFSSNNGASWQMITDSTESDGIYTWAEVPDISSSLCKIKITDAANEQFFDESDLAFEVINENQILEVTSPQSGDEWVAGSTESITWQSTGIANVKVEMTTNNGIDWFTVVENTTSDGFYTISQVPTTSSTNCKIKISDADDGMPSATNEGFFSITPEPAITILAPNGGESYLKGTNATISWTSVNIAGVKIEFSSNGGAQWNVLTSSTPSDGSYLWENIPDLNSTLCQIRLSDADDGAPFDISDSYFTITNQEEEALAILSPNGAEEFEAGTTQNITWTGSGVEYVDVDYSTNNGLTWVPIETNIENSGAVEWKLDKTLNSPQCKVRVKDNSDDLPVDESDGTFTIKPAQSITVTSPVGGQVYDGGAPITISWDATGIENVGIRYTTTNGLGSFDEPTFYTVTESTPNNGEYITSFSIPSDAYYVEVFDAEDGAPTARSTGNFTVLQQVTASVLVTAPNGGENWLSGETYEVLWNSTNVETVNIEYTLDGGSNWQTVAENVVSNGLYNWKVDDPIDFRSDNCKLRISDYTNSSIYDESDDYFTIHPSEPFLRVIFPNGGEYFADNCAGVPTPDTLITWRSAGVAAVDIEYTSNNGITWNLIQSNVESTGGYVWNLAGIAPFTQPSSLARVRITDASNPALTDQSDSYFFLQICEGGEGDAGAILYPSSGELRSGAIKEIKWYSNEDLREATLEYSVNGGKNWNVITNSLNSSSQKLNKFDVGNSIKENFNKIKFRIRKGNTKIESVDFSAR